MAIKHFKWFLTKIKSDSVDSYSAQVSFFTIISCIPFMMFFFSLLQAVNINGTSLLNSLIEFLPATVGNFLGAIFEESMGKLTILSISALTSIWSSSMAMLALIKGLNSVFDVHESRNYIWLRAVAILYTIAFALTLVFTAVLLIFGNTIYNTFFSQMGSFLPNLFSDIRYILVFVILAVFFTFSFKVIPIKAKISLKYCLIGGSISALAWVVYSLLFGIFVENFSNYSSVYGSLAALVVFMLWLYFCMYIFFIGGEISVWLQKGDILRDFRLWKNQKGFGRKKEKIKETKIIK